jgi:hypothetical protein
VRSIEWLTRFDELEETPSVVVSLRLTPDRRLAALADLTVHLLRGSGASSERGSARSASVPAAVRFSTIQYRSFCLVVFCMSGQRCSSLVDAAGRVDGRSLRRSYFSASAAGPARTCPREHVRSDAARYISPARIYWRTGRRGDGWPVDRNPLPARDEPRGSVRGPRRAAPLDQGLAGAVGEAVMAAQLTFHRRAELSVTA